MIIYEHGLLGLGTLTGIHGSAAYKVMIPAAISTGVFYAYNHYLIRTMNREADSSGEKVIQNTYAISVLIAFVSFLLTFKLNFAYGRYWEAATAIHNMIVRFVDCATLCAAFHYQSVRYDTAKPLYSFGIASNKFGIITESSRISGHARDHRQSSLQAQEAEILLQQAIIEQIQQQKKDSNPNRRRNQFWDKLISHRRRRLNTTIPTTTTCTTTDTTTAGLTGVTKFDLTKSLPKSISTHKANTGDDEHGYEIPIPMRFQKQFALKRHNVNYYSDPSSAASAAFNASGSQQKQQRNPNTHPTTISKSASTVACEHMMAPSLFLQEVAHLISLLNAVALSTLRNDVEGTTTPLTEHYPGQPWPPVDSQAMVREDIVQTTEAAASAATTTTTLQYGEGTSFLKFVYFMFGNRRSHTRRTMYNAIRPFGVLGGVSDHEIEMIQKCRGPYAKVALVSMWLQEYISREHLNGSTGPVAPPIVGRLYTLISDGVVAYNQARKIAYVPFPFPNAQIASFFSLTIMFVFPLLYNEYVGPIWFGAVMNFLTVLCFLGLHEVGRELENPFVNVPNDIPLVNMQARMNEALVTMYAGYHPDSWWDVLAAPTSTSTSTSTQPPTPTPIIATATTTMPVPVLEEDQHRAPQLDSNSHSADHQSRNNDEVVQEESPHQPSETTVTWGSAVVEIGI